MKVVVPLLLLATAASASHDSPDPEASKPKYLKAPTEYTLIDQSTTDIEQFKDDKVRKVGGTFSTWVDKATQEHFLYVRPVVLSEDVPDRLTIFAQITEEAQTQSVICDMYTSADLVERPEQTDEQIVFHSVDKPILEDDNTNYNGVGVTNVIDELTWEKTWHLSVEESYVGPQFDHLGYTAPVYTDLHEFSCAFYRSFEQHSREYPDYGEGESSDQENGDAATLRANPDVIQLKVGSVLKMQVGYEKMYFEGDEGVNPSQVKQSLVLS